MLKQILFNSRNKSFKTQKYFIKNNSNESCNKFFEENGKSRNNISYNKREIFTKKNNDKIEKPPIIQKYYNTSNGFREENYNLSRNYYSNNYNSLNEDELNSKMFKTLVNDNNLKLLNNNIYKNILQNNNNNEKKKLLKSIKIIKCEKLYSNNNNNNLNPNNKKIFSNNNKKMNYINTELKTNIEINPISSPKYKIKSIKNMNYQNKDNKNSNTNIKYIRKNKSKKNYDLKNQISSSSSQFQSNKKNQIIKNHSTVFISQINNPIINYVSSNSIKKKSSNNMSKIGLKKTGNNKKLLKDINNKDTPGEKYIIKNKTYLDNSDILKLINIENNLNKQKLNKIKQNNKNNELNASNKIIETIEISENKDDEEATNAITQNKTKIYKKILKEKLIRSKKDECLINKPKIYTVKNSPNCKSNSEKKILTKENKNIVKKENQNIDNFNIELNDLKKYLIKNENENSQKKSLIKKYKKNSFQKKKIAKYINNERKEEILSYSKNIINTDIRINSNKELKKKQKILVNKSDSTNLIGKNKIKNNEMDGNIYSYQNSLIKIENNNNIPFFNYFFYNDKNENIDNIKIPNINKKYISANNIPKKTDECDGIKNKTIDGINNNIMENQNKKEEIKNKDISDFQNNKNNNIIKGKKFNNDQINLQNEISNIIYSLNNNIKSKIKSKLAKKKILILKKNNNNKKINIINNNINRNNITKNNNNFNSEEIKYIRKNNINQKRNNQLKENKINFFRSYVKQIKKIKNNNISTYDNYLNKTENLKNVEDIIINDNYNSININFNNDFESNKNSNYINFSNSKDTNYNKENHCNINNESQSNQNINNMNINSFNKSDIKFIKKINFDMPINLDLDKIATEDSKEENLNQTYNFEKKIKTEIFKKEIKQQSISESQNTYKSSKIEKLENFINKLNGEDEGMFLKNGKIVLFNNEHPGYGKSVVEIELSNGCNEEENNNNNFKNQDLKNKSNIKSTIQNNTEIFEYKKNIYLNKELNKELNVYKENDDLYYFENKNNDIETEKKVNNIKKIEFYDSIKITDENKNENNSNCNIKGCYNDNKFNLIDISISSPNNAQDSSNKIEIAHPSIEGKDNGGNSSNAKEPISEYEFNINEEKFYKPLTKYEDKFNIDKINPF